MQAPCSSPTNEAKKGAAKTANGKNASPSPTAVGSSRMSVRVPLAPINFGTRPMNCASTSTVSDRICPRVNLTCWTWCGRCDT